MSWIYKCIFLVNSDVSLWAGLSRASFSSPKPFPCFVIFTPKASRPRPSFGRRSPSRPRRQPQEPQRTTAARPTTTATNRNEDSQYNDHRRQPTPQPSDLSFKEGKNNQTRIEKQICRGDKQV